MATSPTITDSRSSSPSLASTASSEAVYSPIKLTAYQIVRNVFLTICSLCVYLAYQTHKLHKALASGDLDSAQQAIKKGGWWVYQYLINSDEILDLAQKNKIESVKFIASQILFNKAIPNGGSHAAEAFILARDQRRERPPSPLIHEILPYGMFPKTGIDMADASLSETPRRIFIETHREENVDSTTLEYLEEIFRTTPKKTNLAQFIEEVDLRFLGNKECRGELSFANRPEDLELLRMVYLDGNLKPLIQKHTTVEAFINAVKSEPLWNEIAQGTGDSTEFLKLYFNEKTSH